MVYDIIYFYIVIFRKSVIIVNMIQVIIRTFTTSGYTFKLLNG